MCRERTRYDASALRLEFPPEDSNLHYGFQRPVCCHYTRGE